MIMVDKKILREMSQDVLVIPFTEEMADKLDKFCRIQIENIEFACTCRVYRIAGYRRMRRNKEKSLIYTYVEECPSDSGER